MVKRYDSLIVTAEIDGAFDKRGSPDPLVLAFYFAPRDDLIVQLITLRNRRDIWRFDQSDLRPLVPKRMVSECPSGFTKS